MRSFYHLSDAAYPPTKDGQPLNVGIHGLASCSGIPHIRCRIHPWALAPHFHPCHLQNHSIFMQYGICSRRLFSVTPSMSFHPSALSAVQCPFLSGLSSRYESGDRTTRQGGKGRYFINSHKTFIYASFILILCRNKSKETFECGNPLFATLKIECAAVRTQIVCFNNFCRSFNFFTEYLYFISQ